MEDRQQRVREKMIKVEREGEGKQNFKMSEDKCFFLCLAVIWAVVSSNLTSTIVELDASVDHL